MTLIIFIGGYIRGILVTETLDAKLKIINYSILYITYGGVTTYRTQQRKNFPKPCVLDGKYYIPLLATKTQVHGDQLS